MSADFLGDLGVVVNSPGIVVNDLGVIEQEVLGDASVSGLLGRQGEATFQRMKKLAEDAGWPSALTPDIVSADKGWQKAKEDVNAAGASSKAPAAAQQLSAASAKLDAMVVRLEAYLKDRGSSKASAPAAPSTAKSDMPGSTPPAAADGSEKSFSSDISELLKQQYGPLPVWGWGVTGAGVLLIGHFLIGRRKG